MRPRLQDGHDLQDRRLQVVAHTSKASAARAVSVALAALSVACGGGGATADARARWAGAVAHPPPATLGLAIVDGARAMWLAATHASADPRWQCADPARDLRATAPSTAAALAPMGASPELAFAAMVVTFTSPAQGYAPDDVVDLKGAAGARVFFQARALVSPDGHVGWMETSAPDPARPRPWAYLSAIELPSEDSARLDALPPAFGVELRRLVDAASSPACDVPIATTADLDRLAYDIDRDTRDLFAAREAELRRKLPRFCALVSRGVGPWQVHVSHLEAGFRDPRTSTVATLRARVRLSGGAPCLGPVEVPRTGRDG